MAMAMLVITFFPQVNRPYFPQGTLVMFSRAPTSHLRDHLKFLLYNLQYKELGEITSRYERTGTY